MKHYEKLHILKFLYKLNNLKKYELKNVFLPSI